MRHSCFPWLPGNHMTWNKFSAKRNITQVTMRVPRAWASYPHPCSLQFLEKMDKHQQVSRSPDHRDELINHGMGLQNSVPDFLAMNPHHRDLICNCAQAVSSLPRLRAQYYCKLQLTVVDRIGVAASRFPWCFGSYFSPFWSWCFSAVTLVCAKSFSV